MLAWQSLRGSRGFTGHVHLNRIGFIQMNGRVYDPRIHAPDSVIPNPAFAGRSLAVPKSEPELKTVYICA